VVIDDRATAERYDRESFEVSLATSLATGHCAFFRGREGSTSATP
jgi:hypothetical protein